MKLVAHVFPRKGVNLGSSRSLQKMSVYTPRLSVVDNSQIPSGLDTAKISFHECGSNTVPTVTQSKFCDLSLVYFFYGDKVSYILQLITVHTINSPCRQESIDKNRAFLAITARHDPVRFKPAPQTRYSPVDPLINPSTLML